MKFCSKCGGQASTENEKFCRFCGAKFPEKVFTGTQETTDQNHSGAEKEAGIKSSSFGLMGEAVSDRKGVPNGRQERVKQKGRANGEQETAWKRSDGTKNIETVAEKMDQIGDAAAGPRSHRLRKGKGRAKWIAIIAAALILSYAVGLTVWSYLWKYSRSVKINGEMYFLEKTTALRVEQPDPKDWEAIGQLTLVTSLTVVGGPDVPAVTGEELQNLKYLENLQTLIFDGVTFQYGPDLPALDDLLVLRICHAGLTTDDCHALSFFPELETLDLSGNRLTGLGFLSRFPNLQELDVTNNDIVQYGALYYVPYLETLAVDQIQPQDLSELHFLKNLTVSGVRIEDISAFMEGRQGVETPAAAPFETVGYFTVCNGCAENGPVSGKYFF